MSQPSFGKLQWPSAQCGLDGADNTPLKLRFQAQPYSIFSETRDEAPDTGSSFADIVLPFVKNMARENTIGYGAGETETGHMFDLTSGGISEFFKTGGGFLTAAKDLFGVSSVMGQRPMDMRDSIYQGVNFRTHSFNWRLIPKCDKDAPEIAEIANAFQTCAYPMMSGFESASRVIHPAVWHINAMGPGATNPNETWLFKVLPSVLTKVTINTTPEGTYGHGKNFKYYPAITTLTCDFRELEPAVAAGNTIKSRSQVK